MEQQDDVEQIRTLIRQWDEATRNGDVGAIAAMVTDDCVFHAPNAEPIRGRDALRAAMFRVFGAYVLEPAFDVEEIVVSGEWAFCRATDRVSAAPLESGEPITLAGWALSVLRREADGAWRFARGMNTRVVSDTSGQDAPGRRRSDRWR
ncbi:MAG TPA: SgcJ/EcaC family oxidoreductase [Thermoanaerobaculia bacterium]|jgi:uncharacterized protein (TIGR02246 family)